MVIDVKGWVVKVLEGLIHLLEKKPEISEKPDARGKKLPLRKGYLSPNFHRSEITCKCCGRVGPYPVSLNLLMKRLEQLRELVGKPIQISSGYRCPWHNWAVGGATGSYHMKDMAADIWVDGMTVNELAEAADVVGFGGIGKYERPNDMGWVHVDVGVKAGWQG